MEKIKYGERTIEDVRRNDAANHKRRYGKTNPTAPISREVRDFLSKRDALTEKEKAGDGEKLLMWHLLNRIRESLNVEDKTK